MKRTCRSRMLFGLCAAEDGVSAVEFAFVAAFLMIPLVIGAADFGTALFQWMQVGNAARSGAEYATYIGSFNQAGIVTAVTNATSLSSFQPNTSQDTPSPAPTQFCGCPDATNGVVATTAPTTSIHHPHAVCYARAAWVSRGPTSRSPRSRNTHRSFPIPALCLRAGSPLGRRQPCVSTEGRP